MAEVRAEGPPGPAGQVVPFGRGQLEDGLRQPPAAGRGEVGARPRVDVGPLDAQFDDGQPPDRDEGPDQRRMTGRGPDQGRDRGRVRQVPGQVAGRLEVPAAVAEFRGDGRGRQRACSRFPHVARSAGRRPQ
ncbi:MAG TPA: hypothetical protein VFQ68_46455 [Streptosporangiaceae bacterium]|nr:hypothetical protein [Streptosporangiaceae bacterium]